jgi:hypothetical protein
MTRATQLPQPLPRDWNGFVDIKAQLIDMNKGETEDERRSAPQSSAGWRLWRRGTIGSRLMTEGLDERVEAAAGRPLDTPTVTVALDTAGQLRAVEQNQASGSAALIPNRDRAAVPAQGAARRTPLGAGRLTGRDHPILTFCSDPLNRRRYE